MTCDPACQLHAKRARTARQLGTKVVHTQLLSAAREAKKKLRVVARSRTCTSFKRDVLLRVDGNSRGAGEEVGACACASSAALRVSIAPSPDHLPRGRATSHRLRANLQIPASSRVGIRAQG